MVLDIATSSFLTELYGSPNYIKNFPLRYEINKYPALKLVSGSDGKESTCNAGDWVRSLSQEVPLEKEMATHSSILAWRIPWTEKPGRASGRDPLDCRVGHN